MRSFIEGRFGYALDQSIDEMREHYRYDVSCQGTVPPAIIAFLEADDFEEAIRLSISLGGDADTLACITGGIAQASFGRVPEEITGNVLARLDDRLRRVAERFCDTFECW